MSKDSLKWAAFGLALGIIGGGIGAAGANKWYPGVTRFETIQVQEIRIVDTAGNQVAELDGDGEVPGLYGGEGGAMLTFYKPDGNLVVALGANRDGGGLAIRNAARKSAAVLAAGPNGGRLIIQNAAGNQVARLYPDGGGRLEIFDDWDKLVAQVVSSAGGGQMEIYYTAAGGKSGEKAVAILGPVANGGGISFRDLQGNTRAAVGTDMSGGYIIIRDKDGKPAFESP